MLVSPHAPLEIKCHPSLSECPSSGPSCTCRDHDRWCESTTNLSPPFTMSFAASVGRRCHSNYFLWLSSRLQPPPSLGLLPHLGILVVQLTGGIGVFVCLFVCHAIACNYKVVMWQLLDNDSTRLGVLSYGNFRRQNACSTHIFEGCEIIALGRWENPLWNELKRRLGRTGG